MPTSTSGSTSTTPSRRLLRRRPHRRFSRSPRSPDRGRLWRQTGSRWSHRHRQIRPVRTYRRRNLRLPPPSPRGARLLRSGRFPRSRLLPRGPPPLRSPLLRSRLPSSLLLRSRLPPSLPLGPLPLGPLPLGPLPLGPLPLGPLPLGPLPSGPLPLSPLPLGPLPSGLLPRHRGMRRFRRSTGLRSGRKPTSTASRRTTTSPTGPTRPVRTPLSPPFRRRPLPRCGSKPGTSTRKSRPECMPSRPWRRTGHR
jgi:hypothetical protein